MRSRLFKIVVFSVFSLLGASFVVAGVLLSPDFVAAHISAAGFLPPTTTQAVQVLRILALCGGVLVFVLGASVSYLTIVEKYLNFISRVTKIIETKHFYITFVFVVFVGVLTAGLLMTASGLAYSPDSINYTIAGENLYHHHIFGLGPYGIFKHNPGLPLLIAGTMVFGFSGEQAARMVVVLSYALMVFPLFFLSKKISGVITGYMVCLMCVVLTPLVGLGTWAMADIPGILFALVAILCLVYFSQSQKSDIKLLIFAGLALAMGILLRLSVLSVVSVGILVIIFKNIESVKAWNKQEWIGIAVKKSVRIRNLGYQMLIFVGISIIPILLYLGRCMVLTGRFSEEGFAGEPALGLSVFVRWIFHDTIVDMVTNWFSTGLWNGLKIMAGASPLFSMGVVIIVAGVLIYFFTLYTKKYLSIKEIGGWLGKSYILILYVLAYEGAILVTAATVYMMTAYYYLTPPYPFIVLLAVSLAIWVYRQIQGGFLRPVVFSFIMIVFVLFMALQINASITYYTLTNQNPVGLGYNSAAWKNEEGMAWVANNADKNTTIYSNDVPGVWFVLDRPIKALPQYAWESYISAFVSEVQNNKNGDLYVICFKDNSTWGQLSNEQIEELNKKYNNFLVEAAEFPKSVIWTAKQQ